MYTVALLSPLTFILDQKNMKLVFFFLKSSLLVYGLYIGIWNWIIYVPIALLLVVMLVVYLKQVRSK